MPVDEVLLRDSCGKSSTKIKKYFYYNEYSKDNFPFKSDYNELILLDILDGKISFIDLIFILFPYILIFLLAIICIGIWISICCCSCRPKCLLKRNNKNPKKTRFTCFMVFLGFSLAIAILGITIMIYINIAEKNFNGSICSLLMFQYEIVNGQGLLARKQIDKPYWYGSTQIGANIEKINELISTLRENCQDNDSPDQFKTNLENAERDNKEFIKNLIKSLELIYRQNKEEKIKVDDVDSHNNIQIIPSYVLDLGPKENSSTLIGKIYEEYMNNYNYMFLDIIAPVKLLCDYIESTGGSNPGGSAGGAGSGGSTGGSSSGAEGGSSLSGLDNFNTVIGGLNKTLESISSTLTDYIANYKNYVINFIYKVNFYLLAVIIGFIIIEITFYTIYYFHPFSLIKCNIFFFIHLINFLLILCIIYNAIFGIFSLLMGNIADIIDAVLSKENLSSESPKIIGEGQDIKKLEKCLRGDGNLFDEFMNEEMKQIIELLTMLYTIYTPVRTINEKLNSDNPLIVNENNEYNHFIKLEEIIENLKNMINDFIPTTSEESAGNYDIKKLLDSLTSFTNNGNNHLSGECTIYDTWTTVSNNCPSNENPGIIDNNNCKTLSEYYPNLQNTAASCDSTSSGTGDPGCKADLISGIYNHCSTNLQNKINSYSKTLLQYYIGNKDKIEKILDNTHDSTTGTTTGLNKINDDFNVKFITPIQNVIGNIDKKITTKVYETFNEFLNDKTKDTYQLRNSKDFNLFSWMNCSTIGQDYNATLSTLKSSLTKELKIITYVSLVFEFLSIANLYIMVGLSKNLIDKKYEITEEKNVSIEEIDINDLKETEKGEEIYSIKNKNRIDSSEKLAKNKITDNNGMKIEQNENENNPTAMSINGSDRKSLSENGEKMHEILNMKQNNNKNIKN